jgi:uroporphyrinogen decarboxylase
MGIISDFVLASPRRLAMPVLSFPGTRITGATVIDLATNVEKQVAAQRAIHERYRTPFMMSAMDLSVEAEEFGSDVTFSEEEVPTVRGRLVTIMDAVEDLRIPLVGARRTRIYLETVNTLASSSSGIPVLGGMIGPFSLAGRLFGVSEALAETAGDPDVILALLEKATGFLVAYARAFKDAGAQGLIIAEPTAGLMSPAGTLRFSTPYIQRIIRTVEDDRFQVVLHNCAARVGHLSAKLQTGATMLHFGKPMDLLAAIDKVPPHVVLCGNLDPSEVFVGSSPDVVRQRTHDLLEAMRSRKNFVVSSGCDIPAQAPQENLAAFFETVEAFT